MSRDTKTYKGNKRDQFTIVLEDLRHQFGLFGDALEFTNQNIVEIRSDVSQLDRKIDVIASDVYVLKNDVAVVKLDVAVLKSDVAVLKSDMSGVKKLLHKHDDKLDDHEERIGHLETA